MFCNSHSSRGRRGSPCGRGSVECEASVEDLSGQNMIVGGRRETCVMRKHQLRRPWRSSACSAGTDLDTPSKRPWRTRCGLRAPICRGGLPRSCKGGRARRRRRNQLDRDIVYRLGCATNVRALHLDLGDLAPGVFGEVDLSLEKSAAAVEESLPGDGAEREAQHGCGPEILAGFVQFSQSRCIVLGGRFVVRPVFRPAPLQK